MAVTPDGSRIVTGSSDKTARVWDAHTGAELLQLKGHDGSVLGVAVTPDGSRIVTGSSDKTARVWDANTGAELLQLKGHTGFVWGVAVTRGRGPYRHRFGRQNRAGVGRQHGSRAAPGQGPHRPHPGRGGHAGRDPHRYGSSTGLPGCGLWPNSLRNCGMSLHTPQERQAVVDQGKAVVPRCLTIEQRKSYLLAPKPPAWCIDMEKYPYNTEHWKAWKAGRMADAVDPDIAYAFGDFADTALKQGDFGIALDAAELGLQFDPEQFWILINRAEAYMFLGHLEEAKRDYLSHRGEKLDQGQIQGQWEELVLRGLPSSS